MNSRKEKIHFCFCLNRFKSLQRYFAFRDFAWLGIAWLPRLDPQHHVSATTPSTLAPGKPRIDTMWIRLCDLPPHSPFTRERRKEEASTSMPTLTAEAVGTCWSVPGGGGEQGSPQSPPLQHRLPRPYQTTYLFSLTLSTLTVSSSPKFQTGVGGVLGLS